MMTTTNSNKYAVADATVYGYTNPYATNYGPAESYSAVDVPALWCCCCNERTTSAAEQFCSRRCSWTAGCKCPQCGRKRAGGMLYCGMGCAREASHANWCPHCGVRQLASSSSHCSSCGYVPPAVRSAAKGENHRILDPTEKEHKTLMKQWGSMSKGRVIAIIRLALAAPHRRAYLSYRAHVDVQVQTSGCAKYLHGGEGNELRRFYPTSYACEFGLRGGFAACKDPTCSVCSVAHDGPTGASLGYSSIDRTLEASNPNAYGVKAVFVCRVVCGSAYHAPYPTETPAGNHSTVITYTASPDRQTSSSTNTKHHPNPFFPSAVDDAVLVERQDAVDPVFLILCA